METIDCAVIGAGVVGLSIARALALRGHEVVVLEAENAIGTGTSSRNSEVIHAGIYYPRDSLKATLCVAGNAALYAYSVERGVPHRRCGKLIVATTPAQIVELDAIQVKAMRNGVFDIARLTRDEVQTMEPELECLAALHSPSTGIIDSHALMLSFQGDLEGAGGVLAIKSPVVAANCVDRAITLQLEDDIRVRCRSVVNAAGLGAPALARRFAGLAAEAVPTE